MPLRHRLQAAFLGPSAIWNRIGRPRAYGRGIEEVGRTWGERRTSRRPLVCAIFAGAIALTASYDTARAGARSVHVSATAAPARGKAVLDVTVDNTGAGRVAVARTDFRLSASGDIFGVQKWNARGARIAVAPGRSRELRLTFAAPSSLLRHAALSYRSEVVPLKGSRSVAQRPAAHRASTIRTFWTHGVGEPWGIAIDASGSVWFAEPGCDFAPTCAGNTPPGQIGKLNPSTGAFSFYTLPGIPGNQPIFVTFDSAGTLWFTT